mgnify:CR=1 FL=1
MGNIGTLVIKLSPREVRSFVEKSHFSDEEIKEIARKSNYENVVLATVRVTYWLPDFQHLVNELIWQDKDMLPLYPRMAKFLDNWLQVIEGRLKLAEIGSTPYLFFEGPKHANISYTLQ